MSESSRGMPETEIRPAELDSGAAQGLIRALDAKLSDRYPEDGTADHLRLDSDQVARGSGAFLLAYEDGRPVGCGAIRMLGPATEEIKRMYAFPSERSRGLGHRFL